MFEDAGKRAANEMTVWGENCFHFMQVPRKKIVEARVHLLKQ